MQTSSITTHDKPERQEQMNKKTSVSNESSAGDVIIMMIKGLNDAEHY